MSLLDVKVPDIGDFKDVTIIEVLVQPGDEIKVDQSLITVESDKASMEIPASQAGKIKDIAVKVGDTVNMGSLILRVETSEQNTGAEPPKADPADKEEKVSEPAPAVSTPTPSPAIAANSTSPAGDITCDVVILGGGPGGYSAAFRAADLGLQVVLIERYATLGGVCLNVGCIPSKALLHVASVIDEAHHLSSSGVTFQEPDIDIGKLRKHKEAVVGKLTGGLAAMAKMRKVTILRGTGTFLNPNQLQVEETEGSAKETTGAKQIVGFRHAVIAAGSQAVHLPFLPDDPRIIDSTGALALDVQPERMLILGGGIIGLEMGTVYSSLFQTRLDVVEMLDGLMQGADRDLVKTWQKYNASRFDNIMLQTKTVAAKATPKGIEVTFEGDNAPQPQLYDLVLQAVGRSPNGLTIGAEKAGITVSGRGFIAVDKQMRTNIPNIFAIGDIVGQPMLAHKAVHEGHVAAEVIAGEQQGNKELASSTFEPRVIPSVAYTDPEIAWVGLTEDQAKKEGIAVSKGLFPWAASGRAIANMRDEGFTKLLFDAETHQIVGGGIVGTHAGDMISEIALAIEMGADSVDIGSTIHPHPTLGETIGLAAEVEHGSCTDLPPSRKRK